MIARADLLSKSRDDMVSPPGLSSELLDDMIALEDLFPCPSESCEGQNETDDEERKMKLKLKTDFWDHLRQFEKRLFEFSTSGKMKSQKEERKIQKLF